MKNTLIYSAIRGLDLEGHGRTLHELHQELRGTTKLGLKAYKNLLAMTLTTKHWTPMDTPSNVDKDDWNEDKIIFRAQNTQGVGEDTKRTLAAEVIRRRRALRGHSKALARINTKYLEVRDITMNLKEIIEGTEQTGSTGDLHFDMLQVPLNKGNHN